MASLSPLSPLPSETVLQILAHLELPDLAAILQTSWGLFSLVRAHQQGIYHAMAISHGYTNADEERELTLEQLSARVGSLEGVTSWREVCYRRRTLKRNWDTAHCLSDWRWNTQRDVWRIKVDREQKTIITTGRRGGITVIDDRTCLPLWRKMDVHTHAHCEFGEGFLVFDSGDGNTHEVYRRTSDTIRDGQTDGLDLPEEPDAGWRGHFSPYATLQSPGPIRAYRFIYPTLLVGSFNAQEAYLFDVPTKTLVATIPIASPDLDLINYVELTPSHVLILGRRYLHVHTRTPPSSIQTSHHLLDFPSCPSAAEFSVDLALDFHPSAAFARTPVEEEPARTAGLLPRTTRTRISKAVVSERGEMSGRLGMGDQVFSNRIEYNFTAVHTSGTTLILTSLLGHVFVILDYPAVFADPSFESEHTIVLDLEEPVYNLAFEGGRAVLTTKTKVLLLPTSSLPTVADLGRLQAGRRSGTPTSSPPLKLELYSIGCVSPVAVNEISSVQMDESRVLISYYCQADPLEYGFAPHELRMRTGFCIKMLDFAPEAPEPDRAADMVERRLGSGPGEHTEHCGPLEEDTFVE